LFKTRVVSAADSSSIVLFDLVVVLCNQRVLATDVSQSVAVKDDGSIEATVAKLHREHGVPGFAVGDCAS
jgi:hypothetical protein